MALDWTDFFTAGGDDLHLALWKRKNPKWGYFDRWWNQKVGSLEKGTHFWRFSVSHNFIDAIAKNSRSDSGVPDERTLWREAYSFSERENRAFVIAMREAESLAEKTWWKLKVETDPIWNLYLRVKWESEETHMVGSHLDSVENGGKYDGPAGIACGLEILQQTLHYQKQGSLKKSFCLTIFRSEESWPHNGIACLWSAVATWQITREKLESIVYKTENGRDVLLKDYLESSLRRYFQAVERGKRSDKWEMLWWEGDEYIDHEWWYFFCEQHNLSHKDYSNGTWWQKIIDSFVFPKINWKNTATYHELHIEQWILIENTQVGGKQAQLGIVSWGIGWAKRYKTVEPIAVESNELSCEDYEVYSFDVLGFSDHTGSTSNNPILESAEYRKDAQIATNLFLRAFLEQDFWELISSRAENDEGYTKVPYQQRVKLAIKKSKRGEFRNFVRKQRWLLREENKVEFSEWRYYTLINNITAISKKSGLQTVSSLLWASCYASQHFLMQKEEDILNKQFWTTRATFTNVQLSPEWLNFQLDIREIHEDDVKFLIRDMSSALEDIIPKWIEGLKLVSEKLHEEIDNVLRNRLKQVSDILWYTSIYLPSIPWHDADRVAATWVPIWMVFVRQKDGVSHNPKEAMTREDYNIACHTMMKAVLANLV